MMSCPQPEGISNGDILPSSNNTQGARVYYSCNSGFTMSGFASQICVSGSWVGAAPSCTLTETTSNINLTGLDVPLWLLILFIVLLVALFLALFIFLICYLCCRDCRCCKRSHSRRTSDWRSEYDDDHHTSDRSTRHSRFAGNDNDIWVSQRDSRNRFVPPAERTTGGARVIRVQPGQRVLVLPEDLNEIHHVAENNKSLKDNKEHRPVNTKTYNRGGKINNINNIDDNAVSEETEFIIVSSQPNTANSSSPSGSGNQFKTKATAIKTLPMWMPHSNPIRTDASHHKTTTQ